MKTLFNRIILSFLILFSFYFSAYSQSDIVKIDNKYYTSYFSASEHIPIVVKYTLTKSMLECYIPVQRTNKFTPDPKVSNITNLSGDYRKSGYDKGHNMSVADNKCDTAGMKECFYFSNITPQSHSFNDGKWKDLEKLERTEAKKYGKVIITIGSLGETKTIGIDKVVVPEFMWKVIYIPIINEYDCYCFPNSNDVDKPFSEYKITLKQIEKVGKVNFNDGNASMVDH